MADVIKSYWVSLGAQVDKASFDKFASALTGAQKTVASSVGGIAGDFLKLQISGTTAFASVGFGIIGYIDKLAMADAALKRTALQSMMNVNQYRDLTQALKATGMTFQDAMMGTAEDQTRFQMMYDHLQKLDSMLGGSKFEDQMVQVRQVRDQIAMLGLDAERFGMRFASDLLGKLGFGSGNLLSQLQRLDDFVMINMPRWSDILSTDVIPYLVDLWEILKDSGRVAIEFGRDFTELVGILSGDDALQKQTVGFQEFARALEDAAHWVAEVLKLMLGLEKVVAGTIGAALHTVSGVAYLVTHETDKAGKDFNAAGDDAVRAARGFETIGKVLLPDSVFASDSSNRSPLAGPSPADNSDFMRLVRGVAQVESGGQQFNRDGSVKIGPANSSGELAIGMMQLLPSTARTLGVNPYDPAQNLEGGERYLTQLLKRHNGDVGAALADYGGAKSQYSPQGQAYIRAVEGAAGISIGTVIINSAPSMTPEQHQQAIKKGFKDGMDEHTRLLMVELNGAYAG